MYARDKTLFTSAQEVPLLGHLLFEPCKDSTNECKKRINLLEICISTYFFDINRHLFHHFAQKTAETLTFC